MAGTPPPRFHFKGETITWRRVEGRRCAVSLGHSVQVDAGNGSLVTVM